MYVCFFFRAAFHILIVWRILSSVGVYRVFWGRRSGGGGGSRGDTPLFDLEGNVPLRKESFSGSWTGILYKNVKVGCKQSTFVIKTIFFQKLQFHNVGSKNKGLGLMASAAKL